MKSDRSQFRFVCSGFRTVGFKKMPVKTMRVQVSLGLLGKHPAAVAGALRVPQLQDQSGLDAIEGGTMVTDVTAFLVTHLIPQARIQHVPSACVSGSLQLQELASLREHKRALIQKHLAAGLSGGGLVQLQLNILNKKCARYRQHRC